jgi:AbiV family abortive infection protein
MRKTKFIQSKTATKKMDYKKLISLDDQTLLKGLETYYLNAQDLLETGRNLADKQKYGIAISLSVLSIEELIKAYAIFQVYLGETNAENIDPAFKDRKVHKARLKQASYYSHVLSLINQGNFKQEVIQEIALKNNVPKVDFKNEKELQEWIVNQTGKFNPIRAQGVKKILEDNASVFTEKNNHPSNWYLHAQKNKEKGMYADFIDNKWHSPKDMSETNYNEALSYAQEVFDTIGKLIEEIILENDLKREIVRQIVRQIVKGFRSTGLG